MNKPKARPAGEVRQSQVISSFGPGAMLDLPNHSVLVGGLDHWEGKGARLAEQRLETRLRDLMKLPELALYAPPTDDGEEFGPRTGITAFQFPTWFLAQTDSTFKDDRGRTYRTRPLVRWDRRTKSGWLDDRRKVIPLVPVRFVQACVRGHIADLDWYGFVRGNSGDETGQLWLDEGGAGNDFSEIYVRDERANNRRRPLSEAALPMSHVLGKCSGRQPWLGPYAWEACDEFHRLLIRSASNAYFPQNVGVISIPDQDEKLKQAIASVFEDFLQYAESVADVARERKKQRVLHALEGFSDAVVWAEVDRQKRRVTVAAKGIKEAEYDTLVSQPEGPADTQPSGEFYARTRPRHDLAPRLADRIERVVLVHRLREVVAQIGFTRFEPALTDIDTEIDLPIEIADLAKEITWLPASENRGEGVFLAFRREAIDEWMARPAVVERGKGLLSGFDTWRARRQVESAKFPGVPWVMLHSLSHLLITAVSLECGYSASAIDERIYAGDYGYGILLFTGASGSEGTLGGLVDVGRRIEHHLEQALQLGRLCSNDPVCAQHEPQNAYEERFLHGAACHGCLLIAETSCERRNEFLDRALVVPTVASGGAAFFEDVG